MGPSYYLVLITPKLGWISLTEFYCSISAVWKDSFLFIHFPFRSWHCDDYVELTDVNCYIFHCDVPHLVLWSYSCSAGRREKENEKRQRQHFLWERCVCSCGAEGLTELFVTVVLHTEYLDFPGWPTEKLQIVISSLVWRINYTLYLQNQIWFVMYKSVAFFLRKSLLYKYIVWL